MACIGALLAGIVLAVMLTMYLRQQSNKGIFISLRFLVQEVRFFHSQNPKLLYIRVMIDRRIYILSTHLLLISY